jgi:RNA polymerase sigma factor (sigma-70 family)
MSDSLPADSLVDEFHRHGRFVRAVARGLVGADDAEDVVQETWLAALKRAPKRGGGLRGWFAKVARNAALKLRRGDGRRRTREESTAKPEASEDLTSLVARERRLRAALDAIGRLEETSRVVVMLRFYEGLDAAEIGRRVGLSAEAVRARLSRALDRVRGELDVDGGREAWTVALLPFAFPGWQAAAAAAGAGTLAASGASVAAAASGAAWTTTAASASAAWITFGGALVAKKLLLAAAVAAVAFVSYVMLQGGDAPEGGAAAAEAAAAVGRGAPAPAPAEAERVGVVAASPFRAEPEAFEDDARAPRAATKLSARVVGRVVDEQGRALAGAAVRVRAGGADGFFVDAAGPSAFEGASGPDGRFAVEVPGGGEATVRARPAELADVVRVTKVPRTGDADVGDLVARRGATVEGFVRDEDGRPLAGAAVVGSSTTPEARTVLIGMRGGRFDDGARTATTDAQGRYLLRGLSEGEGRVEASTEDRPPALKSGLALASGSALKNVDLTLRAGTTIEGMVTDASGAPLAGAKVRAASEMTRVIGEDAPSDPDRRATTDERGRFALRGLAPGSYAVSARKSGFLPAVASAEPGGDAPTLKLKQSGALFGRVTGADGKLAANPRVEVRRADRFGFMGRSAVKVAVGAEAAAALGESDPLGWWYAADVPFEKVALVVRADGSGHAERTDVPVPSATKTRVDVALPPERAIRGVARDAAGKPVVDATVEVRAFDDSMERMVGGSVSIRATPGGGGGARRVLASGETVGTTKTDAAGAFALRGLDDGDWVVSARAPGELPPEEVKATLSEAQPTAEIVLTFPASGVVTGRAFDSDGLPAAGMRVRLNPPSDGVVVGFVPGGTSDLADRDGRFRIAGVAPGTYVASVVGRFPSDSGSAMIMFAGEDESEAKPKPKLKPGEVAVEVEAGKTVEIELREPRPATLAGYVTEGGRPAAGVVVRLSADTGGFSLGGGASLVTDDRGAFNFGKRAAGKYSLNVEPEGAPNPVVKKVELEEGKDVREDVALPTGSIEGRVTGADGAPLADVRLEAELIREGGEERGEAGSFASIAIGGAVGGDDEDAALGGPRIFSFGAKKKHVTTDRDGRFSLRYLAAGKYKVSASGEGVVPVKRDDVVVEEGRATRGVELVAAAAGGIETSVDVGGGDPGYVQIEYFFENETSASESGGTDGGSPDRRTGLKPGRWRVRAAEIGTDRSAEKTVDVSAGRTEKVRLKL